MILVHIQTLAREIGVHRNTIRNWLKGGKIKAQPGPGKGLLFVPEDFQALCFQFRLSPEQLQVKELTRLPAEAETAQTYHPIARGEEQVSQTVTGSVMVVGGGIAGIQASLDLADQGYYVYPTNDCAM